MSHCKPAHALQLVKRVRKDLPQEPGRSRCRVLGFPLSPDANRALRLDVEGSVSSLPIGPKVVPFWDSLIEFYRPQSSSFLGFRYRILNMNPKKELLWGQWGLGLRVFLGGSRAWAFELEFPVWF